MLESRAIRALRRPHNWIQLAKFGIVGLSGYVVNLVVYAFLLKQVGLHYLLAATVSFLVAATNNYIWNRVWTFRHQRGHVAYQGLRFLVVAVLAYGANLLLLTGLVEVIGIDEIAAQAIAVVLVTPLNFLGNKLWSFRR